MNLSYLIFLHHPIASLAFISLILAFISLWIDKKPLIWGAFLLLSFIFAFYGKLIEWKALIVFALLAGSHIALATKIKGWRRLTFFIITSIISLALMNHLFPGFHNWKLVDHMQISQKGYPLALYLNYDKPFIGFFPLALTIPLLQRKYHPQETLLKTLALSLIGMTIILVLSLYLQVVTIDLKFPHSSFFFLIANLFFVTIPEEAFFRGFLQREIKQALQTKWSGPFSILAVSTLFALLHLKFVKDFYFIFLTFIASLIYGTIYQLTRAIESSIICHYLFNLVHFFSLTYPALKSMI